MAFDPNQERLIDERLASSETDFEMTPGYGFAGAVGEVAHDGLRLDERSAQMRYNEAVSKALGTLARAEATFKRFDDIPGLN